ncbi:hypothetical protein ICW40_01925 [Actinotalea ferrariae]|uniref:DUF6338 family protein n=1 Tax=Actinotalea ferrariae TaxID=1386098 RepID=UPI001C8B9270|nr:DUF6338 family protein [Actinotalea ferrariae]MBX9243562.1 hypothetical protein [Actinotalea ferrariae]
MIPETAGALLALLGLVAPGLVYEMRRESRQPAPVTSAFREAGRVALRSLIFTVLALVVMLWVSSWWDRLPDVGAWLAAGNTYAAANYGAVATFVVLELVLACSFALVAESLTGSGIKGDISAVSVWYASLDLDRPPAASRTWLRVRMESGTQYKGALRWYSPGASDERDVVIGGEGLARLADGKDPEDAASWTPLDAWNQVILSGERIESVQVTYLGHDGGVLRYAERPRAIERMSARWRAGRRRRPTP